MKMPPDPNPPADEEPERSTLQEFAERIVLNSEPHKKPIARIIEISSMDALREALDRLVPTEASRG